VKARRVFLLAAAAQIAAVAAPREDPQWDAHFRAYIKQLNRFIESLDDGVFDAKQWKRVQDAWRDLDGKACP
jgi:hypothetical protein